MQPLTSFRKQAYVSASRCGRGGFGLLLLAGLLLNMLAAGCAHQQSTRSEGQEPARNVAALPKASGKSANKAAPSPTKDDETESETEVESSGDQSSANGTATVLDSDQKIIGYVESFRIMPDNILVEARMDSGATTSSVNATDPTAFERDGRRWVRFGVENEADGETVELERPIVRTVLIRQHTGEPDERYVVELEIYLGDDHLKGEFTLANRSNFTYKALLGRNLLRHGYLIDSNETAVLGEPRE